MKKISFESSTTRRVVLIHFLGIVLKFPRFDFWIGITFFYKLIKETKVAYKKRKFGDIRHFIKWRLFGHYERPDSLFWYWFRGWFANLNEARYFWLHSDNPLLVPTYFSLFGLVNIQPIVVPMDNTNRSHVYDRCYNATDIKNEMIDRDSHAWETGNFTQRENGTIALYDYASSRAWPMVKKYGHRFSRILLTTE